MCIRRIERNGSNGWAVCVTGHDGHLAAFFGPGSKRRALAFMTDRLARS